jgi:site-specific DNA-methyltransferase (adenine-specific)
MRAKGKLKPIHLVNDDCLVAMKKLQAGSVDLILTDLPYGTTACKWDTVIPFDQIWSCFRSIIKEPSAIVLTASQPFTSALIMSNPKWFRYCWVWHKTRPANFPLAKKQPLRQVMSPVLSNND